MSRARSCRFNERVGQNTPTDRASPLARLTPATKQPHDVAHGVNGFPPLLDTVTGSNHHGRAWEQTEWAVAVKSADQGVAALEMRDGEIILVWRGVLPGHATCPNGCPKHRWGTGRVSNEAMATA